MRILYSSEADFHTPTVQSPQSTNESRHANRIPTDARRPASSLKPAGLLNYARCATRLAQLLASATRQSASCKCDSSHSRDAAQQVRRSIAGAGSVGLASLIALIVATPFAASLQTFYQLSAPPTISCLGLDGFALLLLTAILLVAPLALLLTFHQFSAKHLSRKLKNEVT